MVSNGYKGISALPYSYGTEMTPESEQLLQPHSKLLTVRRHLRKLLLAARHLLACGS